MKPAKLSYTSNFLVQQDASKSFVTLRSNGLSIIHGNMGKIPLKSWLTICRWVQLPPHSKSCGRCSSLQRCLSVRIFQFDGMTMLIKILIVGSEFEESRKHIMSLDYS